jgi:hypothetical protein
MTDYVELQKRCQRGCASLDNANNLLADCYGAIGELVAKLECSQGDLRQALQIIEKSRMIDPCSSST